MWLLIYDMGLNPCGIINDFTEFFKGLVGRSKYKNILWEKKLLSREKNLFEYLVALIYLKSV